MNVLSYNDIHALVTVKDLIAPLRAAFLAPPQSPSRLHYDVGGERHPDNMLLVMPAWRPAGALGIKLTTVFPDNASNDRATIQGIYVLFSGLTGSPVALLDARALTLLRTAAVSAVAADRIARADAHTLLMIGTGALAPYLVEAHLAVRQYERVIIWGRNIGKADALAGALQRPQVCIRSEPDLPRALSAADVVSSATLAGEPLIQGALLKPGTHLDLVGSFKPAMREADDVCFTRAVVFLDDVTAKHQSGDLIGPIHRGLIASNRIILLTAALKQRVPTPAGSDITVFKSVGTALADLAAAEWIYKRAASHIPSSENP